MPTKHAKQTSQDCVKLASKAWTWQGWPENKHAKESTGQENKACKQGCFDTHTHCRCHTETPVTQKPFCTHTILHRDALTHKPFYTQTPLHTETFTRRRFYTQTLLHTNIFTQHSYTQTRLHRQTFTHRSFYTQTLLHTDTLTHNNQAVSKNSTIQKSVNPNVTSLIHSYFFQGKSKHAY